MTTLNTSYISFSLKMYLTYMYSHLGFNTYPTKSSTSLLKVSIRFNGIKYAAKKCFCMYNIQHIYIPTFKVSPDTEMAVESTSWKYTVYILQFNS